MGELEAYIIKTGICLLVFFFLYKILICRDTFFRIQRITILVGTLLCFSIPLIPVDSRYLSPIELLTARETNATKEADKDKQLFLTENGTLQNGHANSSDEKKFPVMMLLGILYASGGIAVLLTQIRTSYKIFRIIRKGKINHIKDATVVYTSDNVVPFSFGRHIILPEKEENKEIIIAHEQEHIRAHHTFDILFFYLAATIQWFNPAAWLLLSELKAVHEYEADNGILTQGIDAKQYQLILVKKAVGARLYSIANSFNHSKIKNRITMMLKKKSNKWAQAKVLLFVPAGLIALHLFAQPEQTEYKSTQIIENKNAQLAENASSSALLNHEATAGQQDDKKETPAPPQGYKLGKAVAPAKQKDEGVKISVKKDSLQKDIPPLKTTMKFVPPKKQKDSEKDISVKKDSLQKTPPIPSK